jgi:hypothetical protein
MQESTESRLTNLEHTLYETHARLQRTEDNSQFMHVRNQVVMEALTRSLQVSFPSFGLRQHILAWITYSFGG